MKNISCKMLKTVLVASLILHLGYSQRKANEKCLEYNPSSRSESLNVRHIIGGFKSLHNEFPHMVALGYGQKTRLKWQCGGTLISDKFVVTAAHCVTNRELGTVRAIRMGVENIHNNGVTVTIKRTIVHPNYNPPSEYNDLALLELTRSISFNKSIHPACLNTITDIRPRTTALIATGWGKLDFAGDASANLMKVDLEMYSHNQCKLKYANIGTNKLPKGIRDDIQICAGGPKDEIRDTCQGDSGGPLMMKVLKNYVLVGVTSFGKACGIENTPAVYTRISAFVPWIENIVWV